MLHKWKAFAFLLFIRRYSASLLQSPQGFADLRIFWFAPTANQRFAALRFSLKETQGITSRISESLICLTTLCLPIFSNLDTQFSYLSFLDMHPDRHDKFHTSSTKFQVRLGCRGCLWKKGGMVIANTFILSFALTKWYQLSPICAADGPPFLSRKELRMELCPLAGFRMLTCIRKNSAFPLQSRRLCTASSRRLADLWALAHTDLRIQRIHTDSKCSLRPSGTFRENFSHWNKICTRTGCYKFRTLSKFRVRLGCRGCSGVKNHLPGCMYRVRSGRIFCVGTRYAPGPTWEIPH